MIKNVLPKKNTTAEIFFHACSLYKVHSASCRWLTHHSVYLHHILLWRYNIRFLGGCPATQNPTLKLSTQQRGRTSTLERPLL